MALQVDAKRVKGSGLRNDAIIVKSSSGSKSSFSSEYFRISDTSLIESNCPWSFDASEESESFCQGNLELSDPRS
jgi:hypothetical protein